MTSQAEAATLSHINTFEAIARQQEWLPLAVAVPEMEHDTFNRARAAEFIGAVMAGRFAEVELAAVQKPIESLYDALHRAKAGDAEAYKVVEINARTDVVERTLKSGHVASKVPLVVDEQGGISQHRQTLNSVQANSLVFAANNQTMRRRTEAETRNTFRMEQLYRDGWFEDYSLLVISRAEDMPGVFYTETMSCSLQLTTKDGDGLSMETAFVAGIKTPGGQQHDESTVEGLGKRLGVDLSSKTPAEIIDTPVLVHSSLVQNGVIDIVELYDEIAGTFFGEAKPQQDYAVYRQQCAAREQKFQPKVQAIVQDLLAETPVIDSPEMAVERLHKLSGKHMVEYAVQDSSIDARVFGKVAAPYIENARLQAEMGNHNQAMADMRRAQATERSVGCPAALRKMMDQLNGDVDTEQDLFGTGKESREKLSWHGGKIKDGTCVNCKKHTKVGVASWCKTCIKC